MAARAAAGVGDREVIERLADMAGRSGLLDEDHRHDAHLTAHRAAFTAELAASTRTGAAGRWSSVASAWDTLRAPHEAAYCRWRAAQAAIRDGRGTLAARLLTKAVADAREHVPLSEAIAATAAGAR